MTIRESGWERSQAEINDFGENHAVINGPVTGCENKAL